MESSILMQKLSDFNLNKEQDSHKNCLNLKSFIDKIVEEDLKFIIEKQSNILELPSKVVSKKLKTIIYNKFNFETGKFFIGPGATFFDAVIPCDIAFVDGAFYCRKCGTYSVT